MRATSALELDPVALRRAIERPGRLPVRATTARQVLASLGDDDPATTPGEPASAGFDPGWAVEASKLGGRSPDPLGVVAGSGWWPGSAPGTSGEVAGALDRLWRHSVAVAFAARRIAREANDPDPDGVARAGMLHALGAWAWAAVEPGALVAWFAISDPRSRREFERQALGVEASSLGRDLAVRWGCEPLVVDSAWLHADLGSDLDACATEPGRLGLVQRAFAMAATTPWAPGAEAAREAGPIDPRVRVLTAEVQARCGGAFAEADAHPREERLAREVARLRLALAGSEADRASQGRFLAAFADSRPEDGPDAWADRAGLAWCEAPGVSAARVVWTGEGSGSDLGPESRPATSVHPLGPPGRPAAFVHLWQGDDQSRPVEPDEVRGAWDAWAGQVAELDRLRRTLDEVVGAHRGRVDREEPDRRRSRLGALAEFAAGAGHELNNPLAVIVGRAQLLLAGSSGDPDSARSLRTIIAQAQRAARILRDLMYVARPPEPRPRPCQPDEIVRASLRDLQGEAEAKGVRVVAEARDPAPRVWADPDPLRQVADVLARNALEATPSGGVVRFLAEGDARAIRWTVHDTGKGIGAAEGSHLFDPFYCGRQAGRGLGLGLPRIARVVEQAGGELKWRSVPGVGSTFRVVLPVGEIPPPVE